MGPDHSQLEIYYESKHGVLFNAQRASQNLHADPLLFPNLALLAGIAVWVLTESSIDSSIP